MWRRVVFGETYLADGWPLVPGFRILAYLNFLSQVANDARARSMGPLIGRSRSRSSC
jgi:hypothetical protein